MAPTAGALLVGLLVGAGASGVGARDGLLLVLAVSGLLSAAAAGWRYRGLRRRVASTEERAVLLASRQDGFVALASHELRTPVTVVGGFAETLQSRWAELDDPARQLMVARIATASARLRGLVEDLLATSLTDRDAIQLVPAAMEAADLVERARTGSLLANVDVEIAVPRGLVVHADPDHAPRMLANLLDNAHTYGAPPYVLRVWRSADRVEFSIRDHGDGVPDAFADDLFEPFVQAAHYQRRQHGGLGLGLHTVARLAELSGGSVRHEVPSGGGAEFVLSFPIPADQ